MIAPRPRRLNPARPHAPFVLRAALLGNLHDAGEAIALSAAGHDKETLFALPGLREQLVEHLEAMRDNARGMPLADRLAMPGIDWHAWANLQISHYGSPVEWRERLWQVITILLPQTLIEIRRYQRLGLPADGAAEARKFPPSLDSRD
jgi:hypothetical protein